MSKIASVNGISSGSGQSHASQLVWLACNAVMETSRHDSCLSENVSACNGTRFFKFKGFTSNKPYSVIGRNLT